MINPTKYRNPDFIVVKKGNLTYITLQGKWPGNGKGRRFYPYIGNKPTGDSVPFLSLISITYNGITAYFERVEVINPHWGDKAEWVEAPDDVEERLLNGEGIEDHVKGIEIPKPKYTVNRGIHFK